MAFTNLSGSAPPVLGSNLLFTSAIKSHPLHKESKAAITTTELMNRRFWRLQVLTFELQKQQSTDFGDEKAM